jgi:hypothetical protein
MYAPDMASDDRRRELRRLDDLRELLRFCRAFGQAVPSRVAARLRELGVVDPERRPIGELLEELDAIEKPTLEALERDRRRRDRRWLNPDLIEHPDVE